MELRTRHLATRNHQFQYTIKMCSTQNKNKNRHYIKCIIILHNYHLTDVEKIKQKNSLFTSHRSHESTTFLYIRRNTKPVKDITQHRKRFVF